MIDLVYPIGLGTIWQDNEIRYSIRSFVKYFDQLGKIFIVGEKPNFLNWNNPRLIHIECNDEYRHAKDANIINKVLKACYRKDLSDDFIRASDDQLVLKKVSIDDFYPRYIGDLVNFKVVNTHNTWKKRVAYTADLLKSQNKSTFFYESHFPMLYCKESFIYEMQNHIQDVTINTYYFNHILDEYKDLNNLKLTLQKPVVNMEEFLKELKSKMFLGYNNKALREPSLLKLWIQNEFREKSEFVL